MPISRDNIAGLVLTGGKSKRMGRDKATLDIGGRFLWQIAVGVLTPFVREIILVGTVPSLESCPPHRLLPDDPPGLGPVGGIVTGLENSGCEHHLVIAVDYPLVQPGFLQLLLASAAGFQAVCGRSAEFLEPLVAYYHESCALELRRMIDDGEIRTHKLYERIEAKILTDTEYDAVDPERLSQINVNTPDDLARAMTLSRGGA